MDKFVPDVEKHGLHLAEIAAQITASNSLELVKLGADLKDLTTCGSTRVQEVLDGIEKESRVRFETELELTTKRFEHQKELQKETNIIEIAESRIEGFTSQVKSMTEAA